MNSRNNLTLVLILTVGTVLRFYNYGEIPFTHDEFSALSRLNFNSFSDLIEKGVKNYQNLASKTSIFELMSQIANLDLFITGDSGPMHIAGAFQVPTVTIFGPTRDNETSQWLNKKSINTNSFHKYGIKDLPKGFEIIGVTKDNYIEIALNEKKKFLGLMFHPERKNKDQIFINTLIGKFIK